MPPRWLADTYTREREGEGGDKREKEINKERNVERERQRPK
jgi:hypothetical protein